MNTDPKNPQEFPSETYWQGFFQETDEWGGRITEYKRIFVVLESNCKILQVGCGNSELEFDMRAEGYNKIHSIDINEQVIAEKKKTAIPGLTYAVADILNFDGEDNSYDAIIDKGTLDTLCPFEDCQNSSVVDTMFKNCMRMLKPDGKYFIITLAMDQIVEPLASIFNLRRDFEFIIHRADTSYENNCINCPTILFEITKLKKAFPVQIPISLYMVFFTDFKPLKTSSSNLVDSFTVRRHLFMYSNVCQKKFRQPESFNFYNRKNNLRWRFWIIDGKCKTIDSFACLVLTLQTQRFPKYSTANIEILKNYRKLVGTDRVVIAEQLKGQKYGTSENVTKELQKISRNFMPKTCKISVPISYLTTKDGEKFTLWSKEMKSFDGRNLVADALVQQHNFNSSLAMSQSNSDDIKKDAKNDDRPPNDDLSIYNTREAAMAAGLAFRYGFTNSLEHKELDIVIIGIGDGTFPTFLHKYFKEFKFTCIELIPEFFEMAKKYFSYPHQSNRVKSVVMDGLDWLNDDTNAQVDVLFIDVHCCDDDDAVTVDLPSEFNTLPVLLKYRERVHERGLVIVNIFITDETMRYELLSKFRAVFDNIVISKVGKNIVLVASHYDFTPRKVYSTRVFNNLEPIHQILSKKLSSFAALQIPKEYRIPKIPVVENHKKGSKDRQKKGKAGQHKKKAIKP